MADAAPSFTSSARFRALIAFVVLVAIGIGVWRFTVRGQESTDDAQVDGNVNYSIVTGAATSGDPAYHGLNPPEVGVTNQDNDVACPSQRPNVQVTSTKGTTGFLNVTVQAGFGTIARIDFGTPHEVRNAVVSVAGGPQTQTGSFSYVPTTPPTAVQITVQSPNRALQTIVPFTVHDTCGPWQTFVGGGPGGF